MGCLVDAVADGVAGGVHHLGENSLTSNSGRSSIGQRRGDGDGGRVGKRSGMADGDGGGGIAKRNSGCGGVSESDDSTTHAVDGGDMFGKVVGAGGYDLRGISHGHREARGSNGKSVASHTVTKSIGYVVSAEYLTVGSNMTERTSFVAIGILGGMMGLEKKETIKNLE